MHVSITRYLHCNADRDIRSVIHTSSHITHFLAFGLVEVFQFCRRTSYQPDGEFIIVCLFIELTLQIHLCTFQLELFYVQANETKNGQCRFGFLSYKIHLCIMVLSLRFWDVELTNKIGSNSWYHCSTFYLVMARWYVHLL